MDMHYTYVIMIEGASEITSLTIVYSAVHSGGYQRKHQSSALLAFVRGIHRRPVNSPHKGPVTRKMFPFDDVIMLTTKIKLSDVCDCDDQHNEIDAFKLYIKTTQTSISRNCKIPFLLNIYFHCWICTNFSLKTKACNFCYIPIQISL